MCAGPDRLLRVEVRTDPAAFDDLGDAWDRLHATSGEGHPYLSRPWASAWWRVHGRGPLRAAARSHLRIVAVWRDDALVALHPLLVVHVGAGRARWRVLVGVGHENADYGGALVADGDDEAMAAIVGHVADELGDGRTIVNLTRLPVDDGFLAALRSLLEPDGYVVHELGREAYPYLDLGDLPDAAAEVHRRKRRNDVLRRERRLAEQGAVGWVPHHPDAAGTGLHDFLCLHDQRWRGRRATGPFASEAGRRFLADAAQGLDRLGLLRLSFLTLDGVPIAGRFGTASATTYYGQKSGWDPSYAAFGPGHLLVGHLLDDLVEHGPHRFDLLRGEGDHKSAWTSTVREVGYYAIGRADRWADLDRQVLRAVLRQRYRWRDSPSAG